MERHELQKSSIAYQTLRGITFANNYNGWIYNLVEPYLGKRVLEIGCGIGNMTEYFIRNREITAIDIERRYIEYMKIDFAGIKVYTCNILQPNILLTNKTEFDTAVCINVLEHINDDGQALSNMYNLIRKKGKVVLIVPAHHALFGSMDKNVGHCRRYSMKELAEKVESAGFRIRRVSYFNRLGACGWFFNSRIRKKNEISILQLLLFDRFVPLLRKVDNFLSLPMGLSLLLAAEKE